MKRFLISLLYISLCVGPILVFSSQYYSKSAQHLWVFNEKELGQILIQHLKSLGSNVPNGQITIKGLETHYDFRNNERIELIVREK